MRHVQLIISAFILFSFPVFSQNENIDSLFFSSLNLRYHNPNEGIKLAKSFYDLDNQKASIALGYNFYFNSDYDSALFYFEKIIDIDGKSNVDYCFARTGIGLIEQRYGFYDMSYGNLIEVDNFFSKYNPSPSNEKLYFTAKAINLIGLATLEYYYTNSLVKIQETLNKINALVSKNNNLISDEIKFHLYYLYAENHLCNNDKMEFGDTIKNYLQQCYKYVDTSQYLMGNLFELIGKYKLNKSEFDFIDTDSLIDKKNQILSSAISEILENGDYSEIRSLKRSLSCFYSHGDPYQIATSNLLIAKYYLNLLSISLIDIVPESSNYRDSLEKYINLANAEYHVKDTRYFMEVYKELSIKKIDINLFIEKLLSLEWYIDYLKVENNYYGLINNSPHNLSNKYLFNIKLIELLEKEKNKSINGFFLKLEKANIEKLETVVEAKNSWYLSIIYAISFVLLFIALSSFVIIRFLRKKRNDFQNNFYVKSKELKDAQDQLLDFREKQVKLEVKDKLIGWFAHETKTQLDIAVTGLTTNKKLLGKFTDSNSIAYNSKEYYRIQRINENINIILDNIIQTNRVTKQLRKISLKQIENDLKEINLEKFLLNLFEKLKYQRDEKNIILSLIGDVDVETITYPIALDQVFFNLMINSIKHGFKDRKNGEIQIYVRKKQNFFEVEYSDNGIGINKDLYNNIFKEFFSSIKGGGGTGLGMSITRTIIERDFSGTIRLKESISNIKTTFSFNLKRFDNDTGSEN